MSKRRAKPVEVEARQWDGSAANANDIVSWVGAGGMLAYYDTSQFPDYLYIVINTKNGPLHASPQDYVVQRLPAGEFSIYKPDVFDEMFGPD